MVKDSIGGVGESGRKRWLYVTLVWEERKGVCHIILLMLTKGEERKGLVICIAYYGREERKGGGYGVCYTILMLTIGGLGETRWRGLVTCNAY